MSRIVLDPQGDGSRVVVGYDPPFESFFLWIEPAAAPTFCESFVDLSALSLAAAGYGVAVDTAVLVQLEFDRVTESERIGHSLALRRRVASTAAAL